MTLDLTKFGFGITGKTPHSIVRELAPMVEEAGFRTLWFNHIPKGDAFACMTVAASVTTTLRLGTGVTSVDHLMTAEEIVEQVRARDLPANRLVLGIGANKPPSPLQTVRCAAALIHEELPGIPVVVGALGPRMRALGVQDADGILLNWLTPDAAVEATAQASADAAGSPATVALYVRTALGETGRKGMEAEAERYEAIPSYSANFARLGFTAMDAAVCVNTPEELRERLAQYQNAVDEPVLRAITGEETLAAYASLVKAAKN